ncbi:MAG: phosphatidylserine/phosphatidylglycerophosphate/cardiolipin synthase family protein [Vulcanibacillus sp.]
MNGSQKSIYINMFIWRDDRIGNQISSELLKAADRGVNVHISKDKLGAVFEKAEENKQSFFHKEFNLGLHFKSFICDKFYPMKGKVKSRKQEYNELVEVLINHPNITVDKNHLKGDHSKYYIFDDKTLIIGGINIEDKEIYTDVEGKRYYDYMVELDDETYVEKFKKRVYRGEEFEVDNRVEFLFNVKRNGETSYEAKESILKIISCADRSLDIVMAYIGDQEVTEKIIEVANRGIAVNMILPAKSNIQEDLNKRVLKQIMKRTNNKVKVYLSQGMVHAKLVRVDDRILTLGSTNLNKRAMENLLELNVVINIDNQALVKTLNNSLAEIMDNSKRIDDSSELKYNPLKALLEVIAC